MSLTHTLFAYPAVLCFCCAGIWCYVGISFNFKPAILPLKILLFSLWNKSTKLTCFSGQLHESVHSLLSITALRGHSGDVVPAHGLDDVHHGLGLEAVWRDHSGEEVITPVVTQFWGSGCVTDLRDLYRQRTEDYCFINVKNNCV